jgi:hypothetical protein
MRPDHLAENRARHGLKLTGALTAGAGLDRRPGLGAVTVAVRAHPGHSDLELAGRAGQHLLERDRHPHGDVPAALGPTAAAAEDRAQVTATEERFEDVPDVAKGPEARLVAAGAQALVAVAVVDRAPLAVAQHLVGLGDLLELLLGGRIVPVDVGMQLAREAAERLLDLVFGRLAADPEDLVVVARHG